MRKVIPYIASQFRKDKIWLRRTKPSKRDYQICLAVDDSSSMVDNHSKQVRYERDENTSGPRCFGFLAFFFFIVDVKGFTSQFLACTLNFSHRSCILNTAVGVRVSLRDRERSHPAGGGTSGSVQVSID